MLQSWGRDQHGQGGTVPVHCGNPVPGSTDRVGSGPASPQIAQEPPGNGDATSLLRLLARCRVGLSGL
eukprot:1039788-Rhodomonas_salina.2